MAADAHHLAPTIELAVSDLGRSRAFYADLLGFVPAEGWCYSDTRVLLVSPLLAHGYRCLVLSRDRRRAGMGGMMLELESRGELLDLYMLARLLGAPTSPLVTRGRTLAVTVRDPDGHRIELRASPHHATDSPDNRWARGQEPAPAGRGRFARGSEEAALSWFDPLCEAPDADIPAN
jgi:catechol 2,3-dioxygenase-like lactoylglutathione lyase family enzyme